MADIVKSCVAIAQVIYEHVEIAKANKEQLDIVKEEVRVCTDIVQSKCMSVRVLGLPSSSQNAIAYY